MKSPQLPPEKISYQEFLAWCDEDTLAEWVDGEVVMASPASRRHQDIGSFLEQILQIYLAAQPIGKLLRAPFQTKLGADLPGRSRKVSSAGANNR